MKQLVIGNVAHVDSGKTTISEAMLYLAGSIRKLGRVDHQDAFLDTDSMERKRGITIFSKQAMFQWKDCNFTLLDTPGHVDFSAEMERTLQVLDYAVLIISGTDGIQSHTKTLWKLLERYQIPTFLFVNKMDLDGADKDAVLEELQSDFGDGCIDFSKENQASDEWFEQLAMTREDLLETYMESGELSESAIAEVISERLVFPVYFGSALKVEGVEELLDGMNRYCVEPSYSESEFAAKVYKIARDDSGKRLTYLKLTGGNLKVKALVGEEKVNEIRLYSGVKYQTLDTAKAGMVCAVTGLEKTFAGQGLGTETGTVLPFLEPVMTYGLRLPEDVDAHVFLQDLRKLEEEDPTLHVVWKEQVGQIHLQLMGEVQIEVLKAQIWERFHVEVVFETGQIVYKETIENTVEGVGHYEPLRHYAEAHLLLEPGERGSGIQIASDCSEDVLDRNWQRLILTHVVETEHPGVLTGSAITDIKITLLTGRAHLKHTEGGDFRQATYRAIRQGLKKAKSVLLEPYYRFRLELPQECIGRAMTDIQKMKGSFESPMIEGDRAILEGSAPVSGMSGYQSEVHSYSKGVGRLFCTLMGYDKCQNEEEVIEAIGYDSERDLDRPTGSVFCAHGAGFVVDWDQVEDYMHLDYVYKDATANQSSAAQATFDGADGEIVVPKQSTPSQSKSTGTYSGGWGDEKELEAIIQREFGNVNRRTGVGESRLGYEKPMTKTVSMATVNGEARAISEENQAHLKQSLASVPMKEGKKKQKEFLLVDGYNVIFAWDDLSELAEVNLESARGKLMDILCNYQGYKQCELILVFDAYRVKGNPGEVSTYHNIHVVYTKEAETADMYIEKTTHEIAKHHKVTVATSDALEQMIVIGQGALRMSSRELKLEVEKVNQHIREEYLDKNKRSDRNYPFMDLILSKDEKDGQIK